MYANDVEKPCKSAQVFAHYSFRLLKEKQCQSRYSIPSAVPHTIHSKWDANRSVNKTRTQPKVN